MNNNRIVGAVLGFALGDAYGAPHEGRFLAKLLWQIIGKKRGCLRWTDDTQMTLDVIQSLISQGHLDQKDLATRFAQSYHWSRGYGTGATKVLKLIRSGKSWQTANRSAFPNGSYGNGAAMRSPVIGLFCANKSEEILCAAAHDCAVITHGHPLGVEGAILIALATALSYKRFPLDKLMERLHLRAKTVEFAAKISLAKKLLKDHHAQTPRQIAQQLGNGVAALDSCITAVYIALKFREGCFEELLDFAIKVGGDVDTIAAMAGAIWGANRGNEGLPSTKLESLEDYQRIEILAYQLAALIEI